MKIKITENQAKRLNLISEGIDPLVHFEELCKVKIQEINNLYNRVSGLSIYEILHKEVDMVSVYHMLDKIESDLSLADKKAYQYIETRPESSLDMRIDRAHDSVKEKLSSLQIIVMDLEKLQLSAEEHGLTKSFEDIKPIDISNQQ